MFCLTSFLSQISALQCLGKRFRSVSRRAPNITVIRRRRPRSAFADSRRARRRRWHGPPSPVAYQHFYEAYAEFDRADRSGSGLLPQPDARSRHPLLRLFDSIPPVRRVMTRQPGSWPSNWEPMRGNQLGGNYQRAVHGPDIAELFLPRGTGLTTLTTGTVPDDAQYCRSYHCRAAANAGLRAVCLLQGAQPPRIGLIWRADHSSGERYGLRWFVLRPGTSDSYTIGLVFQPRFIPGLSLTIRCYHIVIEDAIWPAWTGRPSSTPASAMPMAPGSRRRALPTHRVCCSSAIR